MHFMAKRVSVVEMNERCFTVYIYIRICITGLEAGPITEIAIPGHDPGATTKDLASKLIQLIVKY